MNLTQRPLSLSYRGMRNSFNRKWESSLVDWWRSRRFYFLQTTQEKQNYESIRMKIKRACIHRKVLSLLPLVSPGPSARGHSSLPSLGDDRECSLLGVFLWGPWAFKGQTVFPWEERACSVRDWVGSYGADNHPLWLTHNPPFSFPSPMSRKAGVWSLPGWLPYLSPGRQGSG